jgi:site-specific DNA recombinase
VVRTRHAYALKGLVFCAACRRRMQGTWNHGKAHYRCRFPHEYALANKIDHPLAVYLREDAVLPSLDTWLANAFAPAHLEHSLAALDHAQPDTTPDREQARRAIAECDRKLTRHKAALEAGADPTLVAAWSQDVQRERALAHARLTHLQHHTGKGPMTKNEIRAVINTLGGLLAILHHADLADKAEVYRQLGLTITYDHDKRIALAQTQPRSPVGVVVVSEDRLNHYAHILHQHKLLVVK